MSAKPDYYAVLGLDRGASEKEIADAYRRSAMKYHPDKNPGDEDAVKNFKLAAEAFEILGDKEKRARYDRYGHAGVEGGAHFTDINDIFSAFGDIFGESMFGDLFGRGGGRQRARRGQDVQCQITLTLPEAARGVTKNIEFQRHEQCSTCKGTGAKPGTKLENCSYCNGHGQVVQSSGIFRVQTTCPACRGQGRTIKDACMSCRGAGSVRRKVRREVTVPAGVDQGTRLRLAGEGEASAAGGPPGDCYCFISVREHSLFQREGPHLLCHVPITYSQAALGASIEVPTLDGRAELKIPPGTQPGDVFKLRGRGIADHRVRGVGDLVVQVSIEVPKTLAPRQEELLRELADLEHTHVSPRRTSFFEKLKEYFSGEQPSESTED